MIGMKNSEKWRADKMGMMPIIIPMGTVDKETIIQSVYFFSFVITAYFFIMGFFALFNDYPSTTTTIINGVEFQAIVLYPLWKVGAIWIDRDPIIWVLSILGLIGTISSFIHRYFIRKVD